MKKVFISLLFISINFINYSSPVEANSLGEIINKIKRIFIAPKKIGKPTTVPRGGIARDKCPAVRKKLTALVPTTQDGLGYVENTISSRPNFWFYVPYYNKTQIDTTKKLEFVLLDEEEQEIYVATFPWIESPGIVNIKLPNISSKLVDKKTYRWVFSVVCNPQNRSGDATVNGFIRKVPSTEDLVNLEETDDLTKLVSFYVDHGLWYETLDTVATSLQENLETNNMKNMKELEEIWQALLITANLAEISSEPILPCHDSDMCVSTRNAQEE